MNSTDLHSVDVGVSLNHMPAFMINFAVCWNCSLDCSYCISHDNSLKPVPLDRCKKSIDFIFEYVDIILSNKRKHERRASLNLIGGEPFNHPDIVSILEYIHTVYKDNYQDKWKISLGITTNGIIGKNTLEKSIDYVDFWTVSYHTETLKKQKKLNLNTIKTLHNNNKRLEVRVMSPSNPEQFLESQKVHDELLNLGVNALIKPIHQNSYTTNQTNYFKIFWMSKHSDSISNYTSEKGVTCCSNRPLLINSDSSTKTNFIPSNNFDGWYCMLNWNFLYVDHLSNVYHNVVCHTSYLTGNDEPIGTIDNSEEILKTLKDQINCSAVPVIKCTKTLCRGCGMCATKASTKEELSSLMKNHLTDISILKFTD